MNIGIYIASKPSSGGIYQYECNIVEILKRYDEKNNYFIFTLSKDINVENYRGNRWKAISFDKNIWGVFYKWLAALSLRVETVKETLFKNRHNDEEKSLPVSDGIGGKLRQWFNEKIIYKEFRKRGIDLMIYPSHKPGGSDEIPSVVSVHDLQHALNPQFPEVSRGGESMRREAYYRSITRKALAILVDSEVGKQDVMKIYNAPEGKIKVLPYLPPSYIFEGVSKEKKEEVKRKYRLEEGYIFYPAQFWPHKNHLGLIRALHRVKQRWGVKVPLLLVGNKDVSYSTFEELMRLSKELDVFGQVRYLGFVPFDVIAPLYSMASALVMPTFFGPTNIPVTEAFLMGCPVITSDIRGVREQVGDAGLVADPEDADAIAEAIYKILIDKDLRNVLIERGLKRARAWSEKDFAQRLLSIIDYCEEGLKTHEI